MEKAWLLIEHKIVTIFFHVPVYKEYGPLWMRQLTGENYASKTEEKNFKWVFKQSNSEQFVFAGSVDQP